MTRCLLRSSASTYGVRVEGNALHDPHGEFSGRNILMQQATIEETAEKFGKTTAAITCGP